MATARSQFAPLHVHSHFSLLEGVDAPATLLHRALDCGYATLALTDTNSLAGAVAFVEQARQHNVRPILGAHLRHGTHRCTALIAEPAGYQSLCRVLSRLHLQEKPCLAELLAEQNAGLHLLVPDVELMRQLGDVYRDRLWLEIVRPTASGQRERTLLEEGARRGFLPVASTAAHFATDAGFETYRLLAAVRTNKMLDHLPPQLCVSAAHHLVAPDVVGWRFRDLPEAVLNARRLADQCRSDVLPRGTVLPAIELPPGKDALRHLRELCAHGLSERPVFDRAAAVERLREELTIIRQRGLAGYFLVVRDITEETRRRGLSMALRGSAGSSMVCYLLGITDIDPLRYDLPLARFLHAGRPDLPDIDLDFDWKVRDQIIDWVFKRYGPDHTAMVCTHLTLQPRSAFRAAARLHGLSEPQISRLTESLPFEGKGVEQGTKAPRAFPLPPERWPVLLQHAQQLLLRPHGFSVHPGGILLTPQPMEQYAPLQWAQKGVIITQYEKDAVEQVGLVKIDLLGNRALATVDEARRLIVKHCPNAPLKAEREDDPATVDLLCRNDTLGVNHLESPAMRHLLKQVQPRNCHDVIKTVALIEPGAAALGCKEAFVRRQRGLDPVQPLHPLLEPILGDSHGLVIYEDDILGVIQALTKISAPEADQFRKQILKSQDAAELVRLAQMFTSACADNGVSRDTAAAVWQQLAKLRDYAFCKSHAVSYGLLGWDTAWLKAHHPLYFWAAVLNNNDGLYPRRVYVEAVKRAGIPLMLPCVNCSAALFAIEGQGIRVGLGAVQSLPLAVIEATVTEREKNGPFDDVEDFRQRVPAGPEAVALLIEVGAFDFTEMSRPALLLEAQLPLPDPRERTLFRREPGAWARDWRPADYSPLRQWQIEWERLGFLLGPPLMKLFRPALPQGLNDSRDLPRSVGKPVRLAGLTATWRPYAARDGRPLLFVSLEDEWGVFEVNLFADSGLPAGKLGPGPYVVEGVVYERYGVCTVRGNRCFKPEEADGTN